MQQFPYKLIMTDVDNTIVTTRSGDQYRRTPADWKWIPGRLEACRWLVDQDIKLAFVTNQGGVAFDYLQKYDLLSELRSMARDVGGLSVASRVLLIVCFNHPKATNPYFLKDDFDRKPNPGMLWKAMMHFSCLRHEVLMIGDREDDIFAASNAGVEFKGASDFYDVTIPLLRGPSL